MKIKKINFVWIFIFSFFLFACTKTETPERNVKLDNLETITGEKDFVLTPSLTCTVKTATKQEEKGRIFQLKSLESSMPTIGFEQEQFTPRSMDVIGVGGTKLGLVVIGRLYGEGLFLLDTKTGVFSFSTIDFETGEKNTAKGTCFSS